MLIVVCSHDRAIVPMSVVRITYCAFYRSFDSKWRDNNAPRRHILLKDKSFHVYLELNVYALPCHCPNDSSIFIAIGIHLISSYCSGQCIRQVNRLHSCTNLIRRCLALSAIDTSENNSKTTICMHCIAGVRVCVCM